jgi:integrase
VPIPSTPAAPVPCPRWPAIPLLLGPPKSRAGRRVVGIPESIIPDLRDHLAVYVKNEPGALVFPGVNGGPIRRTNFNKMSAWMHAVDSIGMPGLHFHDLRHTGNQFAAESSKAGIKDLMARMGHDSERAAMIYQHKARGADQAITNAIDSHVEREKPPRRRWGRQRPGRHARADCVTGMGER